MLESSFLSVKFNHSVMSDSLWPHGLQHTRPPCPSPTSRACSNSCSSSQWCHPTICCPFSSHPQSFPALGSFPMSQFFTSCGQSTGLSVSTSALPMNIKDWFPLGLTGLIFLQSKGLSSIFSSTIVQKHQFFSTQLPLQSNSHIHTRHSSSFYIALFIGCAMQHCNCPQSYRTACNPTDQSPPGSSVRGMFQARILELVAISTPGDHPKPRLNPHLVLVGRFFVSVPSGKSPAPWHEGSCFQDKGGTHALSSRSMESELLNHQRRPHG